MTFFTLDDIIKLIYQKRREEKYGLVRVVVLVTWWKIVG